MDTELDKEQIILLANWAGRIESVAVHPAVSAAVEWALPGNGWIAFDLDRLTWLVTSAACRAAQGKSEWALERLVEVDDLAERLCRFELPPEAVTEDSRKVLGCVRVVSLYLAQMARVMRSSLTGETGSDPSWYKSAIDSMAICLTHLFALGQLATTRPPHDDGPDIQYNVAPDQEGALPAEAPEEPAARSQDRPV